MFTNGNLAASSRPQARGAWSPPPETMCSGWASSRGSRGRTGLCDLGESHNNRWLQRLAAEAVIIVDICKPRLIRNDRGVEKNNRGTTGAVRSNGRAGSPWPCCLFVALPLWRPGCSSRPPTTPLQESRSCTYGPALEPPTRLVVGGPHETTLHAAKPSARGQKFACLLELSTLEQGRGSASDVPVRTFPNTAPQPSPATGS